MEIDAILSLIGSVGFPIVMCLLLFMYMQKMNESHKQEVDALKTALNNNTLVLQKVCDKLDIKTEVKE